MRICVGGHLFKAVEHLVVGKAREVIGRGSGGALIEIVDVDELGALGTDIADVHQPVRMRLPLETQIVLLGVRYGQILRSVQATNGCAESRQWEAAGIERDGRWNRRRCDRKTHVGEIREGILKRSRQDTKAESDNVVGIIEDLKIGETRGEDVVVDAVSGTYDKIVGIERLPGQTDAWRDIPGIGIERLAGLE